MDELQKIYDAWSDEHGTETEVKKMGCIILNSLTLHCDASAKETLASDILEYGRQIEKHAFYAGYRQAFLLWIQILGQTIDA